jgi:glycosyltransferase involved in cell wall biosynthesis
MSVSVVIGTFGDEKVWGPLAVRAERSALGQTIPAEIVRIHSDTLARARNEGAERATGDWLVFLDADDELDPYYVEAMSLAADRAMARSDCRTFLHQPATLGVVDGVPDAEPVLIPQRPLDEGNFMVIGTMVERSLFLDVGGFAELEAWEDWDLWCRCWRAGAGFNPVPDAIYRIHVNPNGRNNVGGRLGARLVEEIRRRNFGTKA